MFIYTAKFSKKKAVALLLTLAVIAAAVIMTLPEKRELSSPAMAADAGVKTREDAVAFAEALGCRIDMENVTSREVTIPGDFDEVYARYNDMQLQCGYDLRPYRGKTASLYTLPVTNYPGADGVLCDLLVCRGKVIGGSIYTSALDGFMHGLQPIDG